MKILADVTFKRIRVKVAQDDCSVPDHLGTLATAAPESGFYLNRETGALHCAGRETCQPCDDPDMDCNKPGGRACERCSDAERKPVVFAEIRTAWRGRHEFSFISGFQNSPPSLEDTPGAPITEEEITAMSEVHITPDESEQPDFWRAALYCAQDARRYEDFFFGYWSQVGITVQAEIEFSGTSPSGFAISNTSVIQESCWGFESDDSGFGVMASDVFQELRGVLEAQYGVSPETLSRCDARVREAAVSALASMDEKGVVIEVESL